MSNNLRTLLQNADPVLHEAPLVDAKREQLRLNILRHAAIVRSTVTVGTRRNFAAAIGMAVIVVMALAYGVWVRPTPVFAAVRFEVRLAEDKPIQGLVVAQVPDSGRVIYLHPEMVVSNDDIAQSWVSQDDTDRFNVAVQLLPSGADRMRQATAMHVGRPVAVLIDGSVVMAPVVRSPIGDSAVITGNFTRAEAERIADGMKLH
jgi:hypothetical protein